MSPPITICLPNYNGERFLGAAIQSVLVQTFTDFKVIFVDNCSTDRSVEIVSRFKDPRMEIHVNPQHLHVTKNFNRCLQLGLSLGHSPYLCIIHSDDVYDPRYLEVMKDHLDYFPETSMAHCDFQTIDAEGKPFKDFKFELKRKIINPKGFPYVSLPPEKEIEKLLRADYIICPSTLYRSSLFKDIGWFNESYTQVLDWNFYLRSLLKRHKILYVGQKLYSFRLHGSSYTDSNVKDLSKYDEYLRLLLEISAKVPEVYPEVRFSQKQLYRVIRNILLWDIKNDLLRKNFDLARKKLCFLEERIEGVSKIPILFSLGLLLQFGRTGGRLLDVLAKLYFYCRSMVAKFSAGISF